MDPNTVLIEHMIVNLARPKRLPGENDVPSREPLASLDIVFFSSLRQRIVIDGVPRRLERLALPSLRCALAHSLQRVALSLDPTLRVPGAVAESAR
jgi:hypothetical protein